jgi:hypothetical protein
MIVLHHLNNSRSQRILWLLEELGAPYEIKPYQRDAVTNLAPPELKAAHSLGKSPVIDDGAIKIAESGAIVDYLVRTYGGGTLAPAVGTAAHEAYPGHHTQYFYSKRNLNPLRAVLWNAAMVEGWAVYGEGLMVSLGWGGPHNDRFRFYDLRGQMIVAANILLDIKLQSGQMSDEEAVRFMVEEGFQEKAMAEKKLLRAKLDSTQLAQYFLGWEEIGELERDYRKKVGAAYSQRTFDEALISHGSIAVQHLRRYLMH